MRISRIKNSVTFFFVALFLTMKIAGLHVLLHTDDKDHTIHCVICDHTITNNLTPIISSDLQSVTIENTEFIVQREVIKNYSFIISSTITSDQLFSRPPPFLV